jgi:hypothetical protein
MEHQQAARMPALQHFISVFERRSEIFADISSGAKCLILFFKKKTFCTRCLG